MSVNPTDILDSARAIKTDEGEIFIRNAISRAYYAAYHLARQTFPADQEFQARSGAGVHKSYIDQLQEAAQGSIERKVGVVLNAMKGKRTKADYHLDDDIKPYEAAMQIVKAESLFAELENETSIRGDSKAAECSTPIVPQSYHRDGGNSRPKLTRLK